MNSTHLYNTTELENPFTSADAEPPMDSNTNEPRIAPLDPAEADSQTAAVLTRREAKWGKVFNVGRTIANAPAIIKMMDAVWDNLCNTSLSSADREVIAMDLAVSNGCHYCVPAHRYIVHEEYEFDQQTVDAMGRVAKGEMLQGNGRMATMQRLVRRLAATKGGLNDDEYEQFQVDGVTPQQMIETIAEIAHCTVTNYTNRLARTPHDDFTAKYR